jgi:predicted lipopolysaccharide heptosyltransferase III
MKNILVIKLRYIGDVLLATPALRALRDGIPGVRLTVAVNRGTEAVLTENPDVDDVVVVPKAAPWEQWQFARELRRQRFDCVIDLTDGDRSAILARLTGAPVRIGFNDEHRWRGLLYTRVLRVPPSLHRVERDLAAVRALGIEPKVQMPVLRMSAADEQEATALLAEIGLDAAKHENLVWLQPGARYWFKAWPANRFADLADRLAETNGCKVLIGGDAAERDLAESIRKRARTAPVVLAGRTTLRQCASLVRRCALYVGNDNGPMHMAAAMHVPVVALFGPSNPVEWGPRGGRSRVLYKELDCRQCFHPTCLRGEDSCMNLISVDEVYAAATELLVEGASRGRN